MNDNDENNITEDKDLPWKEQPRVISRLLIGIAVLIGGAIWAFLEQKSESRWIIWGFIPVPWFLIVAGALAFLGEIIKKPAK